jgi:hypothetical protein
LDRNLSAGFSLLFTIAHIEGYKIKLTIQAKKEILQHWKLTSLIELDQTIIFAEGPVAKVDAFLWGTSEDLNVPDDSKSHLCASSFPVFLLLWNSWKGEMRLANQSFQNLQSHPRPALCRPRGLHYLKRILGKVR